MLDGINESIFGNASGIGLVAAWVMGLGAVCFTVFGAIGVLRWASGKLSKTSDEQTKGLRSVLLNVAAAVVLGILTAGISWGSQGAGHSGGLEALLPEDARPQSVTIERDSPVLSCEPVTVEGDSPAWSSVPTEESHEAGLEILADLGAVEAVDEDFADGAMYRIGDVIWVPDADDGDCDTSNRSTDQGGEVMVEVGAIHFGPFPTTAEFTYHPPEGDDDEWTREDGGELRDLG